VLTQKVFEALDLPVALYASDLEVRFAAAAETSRALRDVLGYRLYRRTANSGRASSSSRANR
jgi:hypothetical protein